MPKSIHYLLDGREIDILIKIPKKRKPKSYEKSVEKALEKLYQTKNRNRPQFAVSMELWPIWDEESIVVATKPTEQWTVMVLRKTQNDILEEEPCTS